VVEHTYNPSYLGSRSRKIVVAQAKLARPYLKNKLKAKELGMERK
jgi:hypothetical protein